MIFCPNFQGSSDFFRNNRFSVFGVSRRIFEKVGSEKLVLLYLDEKGGKRSESCQVEIQALVTFQLKTTTTKKKKKRQNVVGRRVVVKRSVPLVSSASFLCREISEDQDGDRLADGRVVRATEVVDAEVRRRKPEQRRMDLGRTVLLLDDVDVGDDDDSGCDVWQKAGPSF